MVCHDGALSDAQHGRTDQSPVTDLAERLVGALKRVLIASVMPPGVRHRSEKVLAVKAELYQKSDFALIVQANLKTAAPTSRP